MELAARERELTAKGTNPCPTASWTVKNDAPGLLPARTSLICATQYNQREQTRTKKGWADCQRLASSSQHSRWERTSKHPSCMLGRLVVKTAWTATQLCCQSRSPNAAKPTRPSEQPQADFVLLTRRRTSQKNQRGGSGNESHRQILQDVEPEIGAKRLESHVTGSTPSVQQTNISSLTSPRTSLSSLTRFHHRHSIFTCKQSRCVRHEYPRGDREYTSFESCTTACPDAAAAQSDTLILTSFAHSSLSATDRRPAGYAELQSAQPARKLHITILSLPCIDLAAAFLRR